MFTLQTQMHNKHVRKESSDTRSVEEKERIGGRKVAKKMYSPLLQNGHSCYLSGYTQLVLYGAGLVPDYLHDKRMSRWVMGID